ncbi:unnamed protein product [Prunus armeniaca]
MSSSGFVPHSTVCVNRQLQGVRHHFHKGVHLLQDGQKACRPPVQPAQEARRVSTRLPEMV